MIKFKMLVVCPLILMMSASFAQDIKMNSLIDTKGSVVEADAANQSSSVDEQTSQDNNDYNDSNSYDSDVSQDEDDQAVVNSDTDSGVDEVNTGNTNQVSHKGSDQ